MRKICAWTRMDDESDSWDTACGNAFTIIAGTPHDNAMHYCCYCGGKLVDVSVD